MPKFARNFVAEFGRNTGETTESLLAERGSNLEHGVRNASSPVGTAIYADLSPKSVCNFRTLPAYFVIAWEFAETDRNIVSN